MIHSDSIPSWLAGLDEEDLHFIKRFVLCSGSLKALADEYGVSYPTLRIRLDKLIERMKLLEKSADEDPFVTKIRLFAANGEVPIPAAKKIISEYKKHLRGESHA
jgi:hypothetical protein